MNIYVGNLPFSVSDNDLKSIFERFGAVHSAKVIMDRETGRPRGFGFVEMSENSARNAITDLNGLEVNGMELIVNEAKPKVNNNNRNGRFNRRPY